MLRESIKMTAEEKLKVKDCHFSGERVILSTRYHCDMRVFIDEHNKVAVSAYKELYDRDPYYRKEFWDKVYSQDEVLP